MASSAMTTPIRIRPPSRFRSAGPVSLTPSFATSSSCAALRSLKLSNAPLSDAALAYLVTLEKLETLVLINTRITDEGLVHLGG